jgi:hypothetical protein
MTISCTALKYRVLHQSLNPGAKKPTASCKQPRNCMAEADTPNQTNVVNLRCTNRERQLL